MSANLGVVPPSSGTLAELKQKRANERANQQQQQVRSSMPPPTMSSPGPNPNNNCNSQNRPSEDSSYRSSSSNNPTHFSTGFGTSQHVQTVFNGSGQSYNQYNSNVASHQSAANNSNPNSIQQQQLQSHKQSRPSAPAPGDSAAMNNVNSPSGLPLSAASKHSVVSSSTSNLNSSRYSDQTHAQNQEEFSELHQSADAAVTGTGHHEKPGGRKKNKACKVM